MIFKKMILAVKYKEVVKILMSNIPFASDTDLGE